MFLENETDASRSISARAKADRAARSSRSPSPNPRYAASRNGSHVPAARGGGDLRPRRPDRGRPRSDCGSRRAGRRRRPPGRARAPRSGGRRPPRARRRRSRGTSGGANPAAAKRPRWFAQVGSLIHAVRAPPPRSRTVRAHAQRAGAPGRVRGPRGPAGHVASPSNSSRSTRRRVVRDRRQSEGRPWFLRMRAARLRPAFTAWSTGVRPSSSWNTPTPRLTFSGVRIRL